VQILLHFVYPHFLVRVEKLLSLFTMLSSKTVFSNIIERPEHSNLLEEAESHSFPISKSTLAIKRHFSGVAVKSGRSLRITSRKLDLSIRDCGMFDEIPLNND
jgi:hypothetical protein